MSKQFIELQIAAANDNARVGVAKLRSMRIRYAKWATGIGMPVFAVEQTAVFLFDDLIASLSRLIGDLDGMPRQLAKGGWAEKRGTENVIQAVSRKVVAVDRIEQLLTRLQEGGDVANRATMRGDSFRDK